MSDAAKAGAAAGVTVREATPADTDEIIRVVNAAFAVEAFFVNRPRTHPVQIAELFRTGRFLLMHDCASKPEAASLGFTEQGRLLAAVYYELRGERGYIGMLAVDPTQQKRGLGRLLMQAAEATLRTHDCKFAEISVVSVRTGLFEVYHKLGYRECGKSEMPQELIDKLTMPVELIKMEKEL